MDEGKDVEGGKVDHKNERKMVKFIQELETIDIIFLYLESHNLSLCTIYFSASVYVLFLILIFPLVPLWGIFIFNL